MTRRRAPGEGSVYYRADRDTWIAAIVTHYDARTGHPRRRTSAFPTKRDATAWLVQQQAALASGRTLGENATLRDVYRAWLENGQAVGGRNQTGWAPATIATYRNTLERHVLPTLGGRQARSITGADVQRLLASLARNGCTPAMRRRVRTYLGLVLGDAARLDLIPSNPVQKVPAPPAVDPSIQRWSEHEVALIVTHCLTVDDQTARYVLIALGTGMRTEELLGLAWSSVNLEDRTLRVERVATEIAGRIELRTTGKTSAAHRLIPIDDLTAGALARQREHVQHLRELRAEFDRGRAAAGGEPLRWADFDAVFPTSVGTITGRTALRRRFDALQAAAGVTRIRLYATRSTHGSLLADAGVNLHALAERLGHTDPRFTAKVYLRGSSSAHRAVADQVGRILGSSLVAGDLDFRPATSTVDDSRGDRRRVN